MKVIIPVAGAGTRLKPHTLHLPKALLPVGGQTVLGHILAPIKVLNPDEVIFVIGYQGQMIKDYIENNYSFQSRFVPQTELLGLGYAIHLALETVSEGPIVIILGDTVIECDCHEFTDTGDYVLGVKPVVDARRFGIAEIEDGTIVGLEEKPDKPRSNLALVGAYYFSEPTLLKSALRTLVEQRTTTNGEIQLTDALQMMISDGIKFRPYDVGHWYDCGKKETLLQTNRDLLAKLPAPPPIEGSKLIPPLYIDPSARIVNSVVGPNVSISEGVVVEHSTIADSILGADSRIVDSEIEGSIVGRSTIINRVTGRVNIGDCSEIDGS
ncbi:MAG: NTP transferase domain-containing protein [candidate division Zixibacteria bacterium]|nr:NTP transferase domain-containing protein [candidate division Zixibacteria bacterium]